MLDAGLDLGKTPAQSAVLLRESAVHARLGYPLLLSASNKRFIGELLGREIDDRRDESLAAVAYGVACGCRIVRVHDVLGSRRVCRTLDALLARGARARRDRPRGDARMTTTLVQGADPSLRDREVQRVIDELLGGIDRSLALDDHTIESRRQGAASADADAGAEPTTTTPSGASLELPTFAAVVNAVQSPPFMTECRVVVVREIGNLTERAGQVARGVDRRTRSTACTSCSSPAAAGSRPRSTRPCKAQRRRSSGPTSERDRGAARERGHATRA